MDYSVLNQIKSPADVKKLNNAETKLLCEEIRSCIIETVSKNGGHLASNLGTVELTVALHKAFNSPEDAIIFDVGHQSYTHKLLTGRFNKFSTIRTKNGISGFMSPEESCYDPFTTGHSSNSISAALGIYNAKRILNEKGTAIAVIGDGAMTGGLAYEALNNAGHLDGNFIVVLNDNKMSISKNVGSLSLSLAKLRNKIKYHKFKFFIKNFFIKIPIIGKGLFKLSAKIKEALKSAVYRNNIFASLGFNYLGPVDGHNISALCDIFNIAKAYNKPSLIHIVTTKGKGYQFAEDKPNHYHGVSSFDINEGASPTGTSYSSVAGNTLCEIANNNQKIIAITAAMAEGTGLEQFSLDFPTRFFDVGIAEAHAVTFASGLASKSCIPFFAVYSTFLQRGFDQILHDAAISNNKVKLLVDRAGIVGEDGKTHQGIFDVSFLTLVPNMNIYSPTDFKELAYRITETAHNDELCAIRYPRGKEKYPLSIDTSGDFTLLSNNAEKLVITYGRLFYEAVEACEKTNTFDILKLNKIFPINKEIIPILMKYKEIYFYEEAVKSGSIAEHLSYILLENKYKGCYEIHAIENCFVPHGGVSELLADLQLDSNSIANTLKE